MGQKTLTYFVRGSIAVQLTSCFNGFISAALLLLNEQQINLFGQIQWKWKVFFHHLTYFYLISRSMPTCPSIYCAIWKHSLSYTVTHVERSKLPRFGPKLHKLSLDWDAVVYCVMQAMLLESSGRPSDALPLSQKNNPLTASGIRFILPLLYREMENRYRDRYRDRYR